MAEHFEATHQKAGTFRVVDGQKQGGNVAAYFCLQDGTVLHAVAGPVDAQTFLREARWAVDLRKLAVTEARGDVARYRQAVRRLGRAGQVHALLATYPLARLDAVYPIVFEQVLGEKVSTLPVLTK